MVGSANRWRFGEKESWQQGGFQRHRYVGAEAEKVPQTDHHDNSYSEKLQHRRTHVRVQQRDANLTLAL